MELTNQKTTCCLQKFNCCFIPFIAIFICIALFTIIIVASKIENNAKDAPWKETSLIGNAFRIGAQKIVIPILRRCNGPELSIRFFTPEGNKINSSIETLNTCGSSFSNWFNPSSTELSLNYLSTSLNGFHAIVQQHLDFIPIPIIDSQNNNESEAYEENLFTVCVLPNYDRENKIKVDHQIIPEIATFFESWLFYDASQFIIYEHQWLQNDSNIFNFYNDTQILFPFQVDKKISEDKFMDANLFYVYDCFYRARYSTKWIVLTTFDDIPMVQTRSSLASVLSLVSNAIENENIAYHLMNSKTGKASALIFNGRSLTGINTKLEPIFKDAGGKTIQVPLEIVKTYNILQLNSDLFQQANTSTMNQIYGSWIKQYHTRSNS